jgi:DNA-binding MarR family transcriptional regulator
MSEDESVWERTIPAMADRHTLIETERAMRDRVGALPLDFPAAHLVSSLYRAAAAVRNHMTATVLREHDLTWTGFVVLWVVWIWDGAETRRAAESAAISKATLTGVVKTLEARGWIIRTADTADRRLVHLTLTATGVELMTQLYPKFNAVESQVISGLSPRSVSQLTQGLRSIVTTVEERAADRESPVVAESA